jgi:hypothetical protein
MSTQHIFVAALIALIALAGPVLLPGKPTPGVAPVQARHG